MKKLIVFAMLLGMASAVRADWLLWTVTESDVAKVQGLKGTVDTIRIGYVEKGLSAETSGHYFQTYYALDQSWNASYNEGFMLGADDGSDAMMVNLSDVGSPANYAYYVELLNSAGEVIGRTASGGNQYVSYSQLSDYIASGDIGNVPQASVWHGGTFEAVPEPSSMALLALGAGLVGLRRKLRKNKKGKRA